MSLCTLQLNLSVLWVIAHVNPPPPEIPESRTSLLMWATGWIKHDSMGKKGGARGVVGIVVLHSPDVFIPTAVGNMLKSFTSTHHFIYVNKNAVLVIQMSASDSHKGLYRSKINTLNCTRKQIGNQQRSFSTGDIYSFLLVSCSQYSGCHFMNQLKFSSSLQGQSHV